MFISSTVTIRLDGFRAFESNVYRQLAGQAGPLQRCFKRWAVRYRSFAQARFDLFSKGGGDWQKLAASTVKQRRRGTKSNAVKLRAIYSNKPKKDGQAMSGGLQPSMLRDTGLLFTALSPIFVGSPGALEQTIPNGIRVGYGGPQKHIGPNGKNGRATIADIASFHNNGVPPRLPQRQLIVSPPFEIRSQMAGDLTRALKDVADGKQD